YCLVVYSFGSASDLAARESIYPARMFTLPVRTAALAGWPMLYGMATMAILWWTTAFLGLRLWRIDAPLVWPALLAAAFLAWTQVLMWMPYGLPGLRVVIAVLWLGALVAGPQLAINYHVPESVLIIVLALLIPA